MEQVQPRSQTGFIKWTTVVLGVHTTPEEYRRAIIVAGLSLSDWGSAILERISCSQERTELTLVRVPVSSFGFHVVGSCGRIYEKGRELNFQLCPAEVGPALRLQYPGNYYPKWMLIAMDSILDAGGQESIFRLDGPRCCRGPELTCGLGGKDVSYGADCYFVFALSP